MNVVMYASLVDAEIRKTSGGRTRSSFGPTQREVADQMIADHHKAGSTPAEAASTIWPTLKSLES